MAFNTWNGEGAPPAPPEHAGLRHFVIELPDEAELAKVVDRLRAAQAPAHPVAGGYETVDPAGNKVRLVVQ
jgi:catechol 2,3-dioxygenase